MLRGRPEWWVVNRSVVRRSIQTRVELEEVRNHLNIPVLGSLAKQVRRGLRCDWFGTDQISKPVEYFITIGPHRLSEPTEQHLRVIADAMSEQP
jgi:hypothetical protein